MSAGHGSRSFSSGQTISDPAANSAHGAGVALANFASVAHRCSASSFAASRLPALDATPHPSLEMAIALASGRFRKPASACRASSVIRGMLVVSKLLLADRSTRPTAAGSRAFSGKNPGQRTITRDAHSATPTPAAIGRQLTARPIPPGARTDLLPNTASVVSGNALASSGDGSARSGVIAPDTESGGSVAAASVSVTRRVNLYPRPGTV